MSNIGINVQKFNEFKRMTKKKIEKEKSCKGRGYIHGTVKNGGTFDSLEQSAHYSYFEMLY